MPYLIDGHNLIGQLPDLSLKDPNDEAKLVTKLKSFSARSGKKCHVVFDHGMPGGRSKMSNNKVDVRFASRPGEADDVMLKRIANTRDVKGWIVVSSDERVLNAARRKGMKGMRCTAFVTLMREKLALPSKEENPNVYVSPKEVEEWMEIFGSTEG
ncbi:MAG: NYN domain-containing protein [Chloroflexota bacterium]